MAHNATASNDRTKRSVAALPEQRPAPLIVQVDAQCLQGGLVGLAGVSEAPRL